MKENNHPYEDILYLPHPVSKRHAQMPLRDRAAQFSPFAALTGYDAAVLETARLTEEQIELDESRKRELDMRLQLLRDLGDAETPLRVTYFVPDARKEGGAYVTMDGKLKRLDETNGRLLFQNGTAIPLETVTELQSPLFDLLERD